MKLWSPIAKLQHSGAGLYLRLAERFAGNALIRDTWTAMASDLDQQILSLKSLRPSFWKLLEKQEKELLQAISEIAPPSPSGTLDPVDWTLHASFARTLDFEERFALKVYAPIVYRLREQTGGPLDFYVIVHAHLTRLARLIQPFSGDPVLIQRCLTLIQQFEKEAQGPEPEIPFLRVKGKKKVAARRPRTAARPARRAAPRPAPRRRVTAPSRRTKPAKTVKLARRTHKRSKPLVKNVKLARRARR
jgi:hypothetical protein